ncbi:metallophosphoesterase family protein [Emergencia sp.]|uniref:metallophosphoesterase family protein n=1 Tax=Emergencia sp. TaxID=1926557 RepID=UPI003AEF3657
MSYGIRRIKKSFAKALHISIEDHPKIVIMSDCHRGSGTWADNFLNNRPIYTAALKHYYSRNFTYIELGDGDELWENRRFSDVYNTHREIYNILEEFHNENRLYMVFGNHDRVKENSAYVWKGLTETIPFYESIIVDGLDIPPIYMFHGYQGDLINDQFWKISRWLVRYLWRPLEIRGVKDPTSAAKNYTKVRHIEENFINYSCQERCVVVAGHTHKPTLMKTDCGMYFNSGSCVHPEAITAIEIQNGFAQLVKWSICSGADMGLYVCKEVIATQEL